MASSNRTRCIDCGRVISKYSTRCNKCHDSHLAKIFEANRAEIASGKCPKCGAGLHNNLAMTGWIQCDHFGSPGFQKVPGPHCDFQTFVR